MHGIKYQSFNDNQYDKLSIDKKAQYLCKFETILKIGLAPNGSDSRKKYINCR